MLRTWTFLAALRRDLRGASAIEFAMLAPVLAVFVMGIADTARGLSRKFQVDQASYRALEMISAGTIKASYDYVRPEAAAAAGVSQDDVEVDAWLECNGERAPDFNGSCTSAEQTARFVQVTIHADFEPMFAYGPLGDGLGVNEAGVIPLTARSTLRVQ